MSSSISRRFALLSDLSRAILKVAAQLGRTFEHHEISMVIKLSLSDLSAELLHLESIGYIRKLSIRPQRTYEFIEVRVWELIQERSQNDSPLLSFDSPPTLEAAPSENKDLKWHVQDLDSVNILPWAVIQSNTVMTARSVKRKKRRKKSKRPQSAKPQGKKLTL